MDQRVPEKQYMAHMLEEAPVGMALLDSKDFHVLAANRCFHTLFANSVIESKNVDQSLEMLDLPDFFALPNIPFTRELFCSIILTGKEYHGQEFPVFHPERGMTYWNAHITPLRSSPGKVEQLLITTCDVTEQARARLQIERMQSEQLRIDAELQRLAAMEAVARCVSKELVSENIARVAAKVLIETLHPLCVYIHVTQSSAQELRLAYAYVDEHDEAAASQQQMLADLKTITYNSSHWIARARHYHEPVLLRDLYDLPGTSAEAPLDMCVLDSAVCIPLWFKDHFEGTLIASFNERLQVSGLPVRILKDCSTCISAALAHSRLLVQVDAERARLRSVLDHLPEGVVMVEAEGKQICYVNEAAVDILNIPGDYLLNISFETIHRIQPRRTSIMSGGQELNDAHIPVVRALEGETIVGEEIQFTRTDGKTVTLLSAVAPVWNEEKAITGAVSIFQDITVRKSVEQQKNEFLSIASHELRTPTTAIQGFAEILHMFAQRKDESGSARSLQIIESILEQSTRLTRLVDEMLDLSSIEHRQLMLHTAPHDLATTVKRAMDNMAVTDRQRPLRLTLQGLAPTEALMGQFDGERLLQVLSNLISNAMKYSQPCSEIEVGLCYDRERPDEAHIWVRDNGIGIPARDLPHIFDRFHRAENFDPAINGLGIGLYLAREIILRHGGSIRVESQENVGSTFFIDLPLHFSRPAYGADHGAKGESEPES